MNKAVSRIRIFGTLAPMLSAALLLTTLTSVRAVERPEAQQQAPPREGACELAQVLFPDTNPGPGTLKEIPASRTHEPQDLRPQPKRSYCVGEGILLGHAGWQQRCAGLRLMPLPRGR